MSLFYLENKLITMVSELNLDEFETILYLSSAEQITGKTSKQNMWYNSTETDLRIKHKVICKKNPNHIMKCSCWNFPSFLLEGSFWFHCWAEYQSEYHINLVTIKAKNLRLLAISQWCILFSCATSVFLKSMQSSVM